MPEKSMSEGDGTIKDTDGTTKFSGTVVPCGAEDKTGSILKSNLSPKLSQVVVNRTRVSTPSREETKGFNKPLSSPEHGFVKRDTRSTTPPPRKVNSPKPRSRTPLPRGNFRRQNHPSNFPVTWNDRPPQSYLPWEMCPPFSHPKLTQQMRRMFDSNNFRPMRYWGPDV